MELATLLFELLICSAPIAFGFIGGMLAGSHDEMMNASSRNKVGLTGLLFLVAAIVIQWLVITKYFMGH